RFRDVPPPDAIHHNVLCVARLEPEKGVEVLLHAWPRVCAQFDDARLRIVGDGGERHRLELLARDLNIVEVVEFTGQHADVRPDLAWANVVAQPSHFEGWGLSVIEATAAGRPVVMTDVGCAGEIITNEKSGIVVPVGDVEKLGEGIIHLLHEPVLAGSFARAAKERVASLPSPEATAEQIRSSIERTSRAERPRPCWDRVALTIALLTFAVSAGYAFAYRINPAVDASAYNQVGWNIAQGHGFRLDLTVPVQKDDIITYQGPLYEYFLAGIYAAFGHHLEAVWIIHALLRAGTALLLVAICQKIFRGDSRAGWIAAALFGFSPDLVEIGAMLMTETLFIFLCVLTVYFFMRAFERLTWQNVAPLAVSFSAAILTRSTIILFSPIFLVWFIRRKAFAKMILLGAICGALLTPWAARNYLTYHRFIPTMANFGYNFWMGNRAGGDGEGGNISELQTAIDRLGPIDANYYAMDQFKSFIAAHPVSYLKLTATRIVKYFSFLRPMGFWFYQTGWTQAVFVASSVAAAFFLFVTSFSGMSLAWRKERHAELAYVAAFGAVMFVSIAPILFETRYRLPIYPFLAIFSGLFLSRWWSAKREYARDLVTGLFLICAFGIGTAALEWQKIAERASQLLNRNV
ncbi:MAG: glycosyltransferase, partial [Patescibacteria group bacterium]